MSSRWGSSKAKKGVCTMCTPCPSDRGAQRPDWLVLGMFSRVLSVFKAGKVVRVPPRARHIPSSEGFCFNVLTWLVVASL
jgi:hypothetical protein